MSSPIIRQPPRKPWERTSSSPNSATLSGAQRPSSDLALVNSPKPWQNSPGSSNAIVPSSHISAPAPYKPWERAGGGQQSLVPSAGLSSSALSPLGTAYQSQGYNGLYGATASSYSSAMPFGSGFSGSSFGSQYGNPYTYSYGHQYSSTAPPFVHGFSPPWAGPAAGQPLGGVGEAAMNVFGGAEHAVRSLGSMYWSLEENLRALYAFFSSLMHLAYRLAFFRAHLYTFANLIRSFVTCLRAFLLFGLRGRRLWRWMFWLLSAARLLRFFYPSSSASQHRPSHPLRPPLSFDPTPNFDSVAALYGL